MSDAIPGLGALPAAPTAAGLRRTAPPAGDRPAPTLGRDTLTAASPPRFDVLAPLPWVSHHLVRLTEPLGVDGRFVVGGLVAGKVAGGATKWASMAQQAYRIHRTVGLKAFVQEAGAMGAMRQAGASLGKGSLRAVAVTGVCLAGGIAAGYIAHRVSADRPASLK